MCPRVKTLPLILTMLSATLLYGQGGANGTIVGTVSDNSGAVLANAAVEVTNTATNVHTQTHTTSAGDFTVPFLQPGNYRLAVDAVGFQKSVVDNIQLVVGQHSRVDVTLKPGSISESVEVQAVAAALDTDSAAVSQVITQKQVQELPLNSRDFLSLIFLGAGAVQTSGEQGSMRHGEGDAISINGSRPTSNNYLLDGLVDTDAALNTPAVVPSIEALQEFKEQTATYSAEYGFSANQINIATRPGTNQIHGTGFWFGRNDFADARDYFADPTTKKPELRQHQFGYVVSGPVYIPHLYDGRNKTFFMANYEGWRILSGAPQFFNVPDQAWLTGNFAGSGLPAFGTTACSAALANDQPCMPVDPATGAPFANNQIPSSSFSRVAQVALAAHLFPAPNCVGCTNGNYVISAAFPTRQNQQTYRLDQSLGRFGSVFGRFTKAAYSVVNQQTATSNFGDAVFDQESSSWALSHTISLGQHIVNNFRFGSLQPKADQVGVGAPKADINALQLTGVFANLPAYANTYPGINLDQVSGVGSPVNDVTTSYIPMWEYADSLSVVHGKHTLGIGFDYRRWVQNRNLANDYNGQMSYRSDLILTNGSATGFNGEPANNCTTVTCGTGNMTADFLLGYYSNAATFQPGPFSSAATPGNLNQYHFTYFAPYVQDDWRVNNRLTLNLGLRWDYRSVPYETNNKMGWLDVTNPAGGLCVADKRLDTAGVADSPGSIYRFCGRRNPADGSKKPFAPRFGFAWRPFGEKTVLRGGYGIFFDSAEGREIDDSGDIYPYEVRSSLSPATSPTPLPKLTNGLFPSAAAPGPATAAVSTFIAVIISEKPRNPYVQQWTLSAQRQLTKNTTLELDYIGTKGLHLLARNNIGQPLAPTNPAVCQANPANCPPAARRPYPNFNIYIDSKWTGYSNYNAGNVKLEHRTSSLLLNAVYTWSKSLDDKSAAAGIGNADIGWQGFMDNHRPQLDYGLSDFDVSQRFVTSFVYELPVGRGKHLGNNMNKAINAVVGGWQLNGIVTLQKGFPYTIFGPDQSGVLATFGNRANLVGNPNPSGFRKTVSEWFNTSAFASAPVAVYGDSPRNILRGPGINDWDLGLTKNFALTERSHLQVRFESFNAFNHPQFNNPAGRAVGGQQFGVINSAKPQRQLQLGAKLSF